jgi:hypothetical protein
MLIILFVIATVLTALAGDAVAESVLDGGDDIVALRGFAQFATTTSTTLTILTILSATAALAWAAVIALSRGRGLERRMAEELDERWDAQSRHNAGVEGRNKLLEYRVAELQTKLEELAGKRDALVEEIRAVRKRTSELQNIAHEQRETILRLTGGVGSDDELIIVPEPPIETAHEGLTGDEHAEATTVEVEGGGGGDLGRDQEPATSGAQAVERRVGVGDDLGSLGF